MLFYCFSCRHRRLPSSKTHSINAGAVVAASHGAFLHAKHSAHFHERESLPVKEANDVAVYLLKVV